MQIEGKQYFDEYVLVAPGSDYGRVMWGDIGEMENGTILEQVLDNHKGVLNVLHHVHFSFAINNCIQLPFQSIWHKYYALSRIDLNPDKRYCVIFTDISACRTDEKYFNELKSKKNITLVLAMVNTMIRKKKLLERRLSSFELVFSFDKTDCENNGFIYHPTNYSTAAIVKNNKVMYDAFFVGVSKGRQSILEKIYNKLNTAGAKCSFFIVGVKKKNVLGIHYNEWLSYKQVLSQIENSNCIIEVMEGEQQGVTLRAMEAICYNKRLLTNNKSIKDLSFYKTGNIMVFDSIEEINPEFVKNSKDVDYEYNNEFSPIHLIEHINRICEKKQKLEN